MCIPQFVLLKILLFGHAQNRFYCFTKLRKIGYLVDNDNALVIVREKFIV